MAKPPPLYRKLPGTKGNLFGRARLWQGSDHLLEVTATGGIEGYRRFPYGEIQALVLQPTFVGRTVNYVLAGISLLSGGGSFLLWYFSPMRPEEIGVVVICSIIAGALLLAVLINALYGRTCRLHVQTAAGLTLLAAPGRVRPTRKLLTRIAPVIEAAQAAEPPPIPESGAPTVAAAIYE